VSSGIVESSSHGSQGSESSQASQQPSRSKLVQRLLTASSALPAFVHDLITTQAVVVAGTEAVGFLIEKGAENTFSLRPIAHVRPDNAPEEVRQQAIAAFQEIINPCVAQGKDGAIEVGGTGDGGEAQYCLVTLLRNEGQVVAVSGVITRCLDLERAQQRLVSMQLVAGYFDLYTLRRASEQSRMIAQSHQHSLQLASSVSTAEGFEQGARSFCNEMAARSGATRVSLGWVKGTKIKIVALSHTEQFDKKQDVIVQLEKVMEECVDQEEVVQFDPEGQTSTQNVTRTAAAFSRAQANVIVLSLPLRNHTEIVGVVTLEFDAKRRIGPNAAEALTVATDLLGPQLYDRYENDRYIFTKMGLSVREGAKMVMGPKHMLPKTVVALLLAATAFVCLYRPMYHVAAPFSFATVEKRVLCAPYDGYIGDIAKINGEKMHAGLSVKKGDLLMTMETSDLKLKRAEALSRAGTARKQAQKATSERKDADAGIYNAQADAAEAEAKLYADQISRAELRSPVDGEILKCEIEDKKGAPVKIGDVLFEVAQKDNLRVQINVADRDIQFVKPGANGTLATSTLPSDSHELTVHHIVPLGEAKDGSNVFTVFADVKNVDPGWRPGLTGEVRIDVEKKPLIWIWTHRLVDFLRLKLWM
jgi:multidrug resistance efflux pump